MWTQTSFDTSFDPAAHTAGVKVQRNGAAYPVGWPTDDSGIPQGWEGHTWRWRPYSEIDPSNINSVAGFAPSRAYNVDTPGVILMSGDGADVVRSSHWMDVPEGQYDFRIKRNTGDAGDNRTVLVSTLLQLKAIQPDNADYTGQKRMAIRVKASSQLNGTLDNVSAIATAKVPVWNGSSWVTQATLNPAWWFLWFARGAFDAEGRRLYGAGMADSKIDIDKIIRWAAYCDANGFTIRKVLDKSTTVSAVLDAIAQCGFASKGWPNGKLSVIWTEKDQPAVCLFTPDNIKRGSFEIDWIGSDDLAEEIVVNYINPSTWETAAVRQIVPGVTSPKNSTTIDFDGCANEEMAGKYANLKAASQVLHRRTISWDADIEGLMVRRGDIALMSHDMTQWAYAGRLLAGSHQSITLDKPVPQSSLGGWVTLRSPSGRIFTRRVVAGSGETSTLTFVTPVPVEDGEGIYDMPSDGGNPLDWVWCYDPQSSVPGMRLLVTQVAPADYNTVRITAVDDAASYYDSISNAYAVLAAPQLAVQSYRVMTAAIYTGNYDASIGKYLVTSTWTMDRQCKVRVDCTVNGDVVAASVGVGTAAVWARAGDVVKFTISPTPDSFATVYPRWVQTTVTGVNVPLPDVAGLRVESAFTGKEFSVAWDAVENATGYIGEVWAGGAKRRNVDFGNVLRYAYTLDEAKADGGPYRTVTIKVKAVGEAGQSVNWAAVTASNPAPATPTGLRANVGFGSILVSWDPPIDLDVAGYLVHMSTSPGFTPATGNRVSDDSALSALITRTSNAGVLAVGTTYYIRVAAYDLFGRESLNYSGELAVTMTAIPAALLELQNLGPANFDTATAEAIANMQELNNADLDALAQIDTELLASMSSELQAARDAVQDQALTMLNTLAAQDTEAGKRRAASAAIVRETQTRITELQAVAEDILALVSRIGTAEAGIVSANQAIVDGDSALAQQITSLASTVGSNKASADSSIQTLTNADAALSGQITSLSATVTANKTAADQAAATNAAAITTEQQARASGDAALSQQITNLRSTVNGNTTSISALTQSVDGILGQWSVSIVQNAQGIKKVSGVRLLSDGTSSAFDVLADVFRVSLPDGSGSKQVFTVGAISGVPAVGISGNLLIDGTIEGRSLIAQSVTADKIDTRNLTIKDDYGNVIFGAGTNIDLSRINGLGALASKSMVGAADMSVSSLSAITATLGTFKSAESGQRTEISDSLVKVYDANGVLRVRLGVWQ